MANLTSSCMMKVYSAIYPWVYKKIGHKREIRIEFSCVLRIWSLYFGFCAKLVNSIETQLARFCYTGQTIDFLQKESIASRMVIEDASIDSYS